MSDSPVRVVSIMNYPAAPLVRRMCYAFVDSVIAGGAKSLRLLYEDHEPFVAPEHRRAIDVELVRGRSRDVGHPHFNLRFKLPNLAAESEPFLFLDADMYVLGDLSRVWQHRRDKPWIGTDHQWVPADARTHRPPFLNSGLQLVGDPDFYDLDAILAVQNAAAPLARWLEIPKATMFPCPGADQAVLFRYFRTTGYDYTHPDVGPAWNSCAGVTAVERRGDRWAGRTVGLEPGYDVQIVHYWSQFKPWSVGCPVFQSYAWVDAAYPIPTS